jgi:hypothetical protein
MFIKSGRQEFNTRSGRRRKFDINIALEYDAGLITSLIHWSSEQLKMKDNLSWVKFKR